MSTPGFIFALPLTLPAYVGYTVRLMAVSPATWQSSSDGVVGRDDSDGTVECFKANVGTAVATVLYTPKQRGMRTLTLWSAGARAAALPATTACDGSVSPVPPGTMMVVGVTLGVDGRGGTCFGLYLAPNGSQIATTLVTRSFSPRDASDAIATPPMVGDTFMWDPFRDVLIPRMVPRLGGAE